MKPYMEFRNEMEVALSRFTQVIHIESHRKCVKSVKKKNMFQQLRMILYRFIVKNVNHSII